ncbi:MAG: ABC transporter ATP-binding protein [Gammaproteobacteria bacterium]|nr:ABC transporter ATP-binding protein [Gammaproteobacteria bacterium]
MNALVIEQLRKTYDSSTEALKGIDLAVESGDFFALLGPNGAGKSTAIGIVASLVNKSSGRVTVFGHDLDTERSIVKSHIGLVPQDFNFSGFEPIFYTLLNVAGYNGIPRKIAKDRASYYLKKLELWEKRDTPGRELSGGMKRRLMIARALVHEPRLLILDEPTAGVDIEIRRSMWELLSEINKEQGTTIILTTHYLEEAEALCKNVAIIDDGKIIEQGAVAKLLSSAMLETFVLDLQEPIRELPISSPFELRVREDSRLEADVLQHQNVSELIGFLQQQNIIVKSLRNKSNRLEEFFLRLVNQTVEEEQA